MMTVLLVEPGRKPEIREIDGTVESMREIVGGKFQAMYPAEDIALVFNNDSDVPLPPQNRGVRNNIVCRPLCLRCRYPSARARPVARFVWTFSFPRGLRR